jgi:phosphoglycerate kinase
MRTLDHLDVGGKRVLLRVDFNVPMEGERILDDSRIRQTVPTFQSLLDRGAAVVVATHLGRPEGHVGDDLRVEPLAQRLRQLLGREVKVAGGMVGPAVEAQTRGLKPGQVLMLENVRFDPGEEANDPAFARGLAALADCYVDDAFGAAHRAHASTEGVAHLLPGAAGLLMEKEVEFLGRVLNHPEPPLVAIVGGAKVSTKIGVMEHLLPRVSQLLVGGAMASTLLKSEGAEVGSSMVEEDQLDTARRLIDEGGEKLVMPSDAVVADAFDASAERREVDIDDLPPGWMMLDIGPRTVEAFSDVVASAGTVVWNGPLGVCEMEPFRAGTEAVARALASSKAVSIVGGGDLAAALSGMGLEDAITHVSTGGGATLEFLEGKDLPGIKALDEDAG